MVARTLAAINRTWVIHGGGRGKKGAGGGMLGVFACKRAAASLGGENPTGTRRRRHDYRSLPSSDGRCQSFRSGDENEDEDEGDAGGRRREERDPDSGGI